MSSINGLTGRRFGKLVAVERLVGVSRKHQKWVCKCDCGRLSSPRAAALISGNTTSCGACKKGIPRKKKEYHGLSKSKEYVVWASMIRRCTNQNNKYWSRYGGRGITVCDRWLNSVENFIADMGPCQIGMSIDRIDNNLGYEPGNCRWATSTEQVRNRSISKRVTVFGIRASLHEWAACAGVNYCTVLSRLKRGLSDAKALGLDDLMIAWG